VSTLTSVGQMVENNRNVSFLTKFAPLKLTLTLISSQLTEFDQQQVLELVHIKRYSTVIKQKEMYVKPLKIRARVKLILTASSYQVNVMLIYWNH